MIGGWSIFSTNLGRYLRSTDVPVIRDLQRTAVQCTMYNVFYAYNPALIVSAMMMRQHQTSLMLKFDVTPSPLLDLEPMIGTSECAHVHLFTVTRMKTGFIKTDFPHTGGLGPQWNE